MLLEINGKDHVNYAFLSPKSTQDSGYMLFITCFFMQLRLILRDITGYAQQTYSPVNIT